MLFKKHILILLPFLILPASCHEIYYPDIDKSQTLLVVDGLITDQSGPYLIKLSWAVPFDTAITMKPVSDAVVFVTDDTNNTFNFKENIGGSGKYYSKPGDRAIPGHSYTLHIYTDGGGIYESSPQILLSNRAIDSIYGTKTSRNMYLRNPAGHRFNITVRGGNIFLNINQPDIHPALFRFVYGFYIQYTYTIPDVAFPPVFFCWKKMPPSTDIHLTGIQYANNTEGLKKYPLCFLPFDKVYYTLDNTRSITKYVVILKQYRLNEDAFNFYKTMDKLLRAEGKIFDPISTQLTGNVHGLNKNQKDAIGFFETSSALSYTFLMQSMAGYDQLSFVTGPSLDNIPQEGCIKNKPPSFWLK